MAVEVQYFALEAGKRNEVQLPQVHPALFIVVGFFTQCGGQAQEEFMGGDSPWLGFAPYQLAQGESTAPAQQLIAPLVVQAAALIQHKKDLKLASRNNTSGGSWPAAWNSSTR
ncbi:hypothetical protein PFLmoz3_00064 [Pseudomonas fluorescens]|uniref:Uncharacterized protein n=1 Tax=Pseudomonas fluorescens TaxID=294 RepID=A0A109LLK1_PSEFL|nr:hypothetical protein PFLmoz3_00064 [Pseudomonas fluorescens]